MSSWLEQLLIRKHVGSKFIKRGRAILNFAVCAVARSFYHVLLVSLARLLNTRRGRGGVWPARLAWQPRKTETESPDLLNFFLPKGQMEVGIRGGLKVAIHVTRKFLHKFNHIPDLCLLKVDFQNAFNECNRDAFLDSILDTFPYLYGWIQWCYSCAAELRFGHHRLLATAGVQQGDPLCPLLFVLTLARMLNSIPTPRGIGLNLWYLDNGIIIGNCNDVANFFDQISIQGPKFGLKLNPRKCEAFWPSGDHSFPELHSDIIRLQEGVSLLGSPIWGTNAYISSTVQSLVDSVNDLHLDISLLQDPQAELHLLRSCASVCKLNHILRTVPYDLITSQLSSFDTNLRSTLSHILHSQIPDTSWIQATLPFRVGGLGLRESCDIAKAAFIASCNMSNPLIDMLLTDSLQNEMH